MRKKSISIVAGCLVSLLIMANPVYAAEQVGYRHDAEIDTADYCLSVHDVSIDLSELRECGDEQEVQNEIIETANPAILIRNSNDGAGGWIRLSYEELTFDFSQFRPEENADGYTVTVAAPPIKLDKPSEIAFQVYVTNNYPDVYANITFANTDLAVMNLNITNGAVLSWNEIPTPQKDGYTFLGWYLDENCTEPFLLPDNEDYAAQDITGDLTLYPKWEKNIVLAAVHFADGCLPDMELDITYGASLTLLNIKSPVKNGYSFCGWYLDENCTEPFLLPDNEDYAAQEITGDITLYPKWEKNIVYATVHFADGEFADMTLDITDGATLTLTAAGVPAKDGYTFSGWYLDSEFTVPFFIPGQTDYAEQIISENITLYSRFQPVVVPPVEQPEQPIKPVQPEKPPAAKPTEVPATPEETIQPEPDVPVKAPEKETTAPVQEQIKQNDTPVIKNEKITPEENWVKEGVPMYEYVILLLFAAITAGFGFSIASDVRVLSWYRKKKRAYLAKMEMMP